MKLNLLKVFVTLLIMTNVAKADFSHYLNGCNDIVYYENSQSVVKFATYGAISGSLTALTTELRTYGIQINAYPSNKSICSEFLSSTANKEQSYNFEVALKLISEFQLLEINGYPREKAVEIRERIKSQKLF